MKEFQQKNRRRFWIEFEVSYEVVLFQDALDRGLSQMALRPSPPYIDFTLGMGKQVVSGK